MASPSSSDLAMSITVDLWVLASPAGIVALVVGYLMLDLLERPLEVKHHDSRHTPTLLEARAVSSPGASPNRATSITDDSWCSLEARPQ